MKQSTALQIACLVVMAICILMLVESTNYAFYDDIGPGGAFLPVLTGISTGLLALVVFYQTRKADPADEELFTIPRGLAGVQILALLGALVFAGVLLQPLGYRITIFIFTVGLCAVLGARNWFVTLLMAAALSFGAFHVLYYWLNLPLPIGQLGI